MSPEIPDYYKHLAVTPPEKKDVPQSGGMPIPASARQAPPQNPTTPAPRPYSPGVQSPGIKPSISPPVEENTTPYNANAFTINLPDGWSDGTVFTLFGPSIDDIRHNIVVTLKEDIGIEDLNDFAAWQIKSMDGDLKSCQILREDRIELYSGIPAYRAIYVWWPTEEQCLYQEQIYILHNDTGYTLTASFSKKTRKTLGPAIERIMLSFHPF